MNRVIHPLVSRSTSVLTLVISSSLLFSCKSNQEQRETAETPSYPVITPQVADVPQTWSYVASVESENQISIKSRGRGLVEAIRVVEGAKVKKGEVLFVIGKQELEIDVRRATAERDGNEAEVKVATIELENTKALLQKKIVSETEVALAEAKVAAAEAALAQSAAELAKAQLDLSYSEVVAPADGTISRIPNKVGALVDEGDFLTDFSSDGDMLAYFNVPERDYFLLAANPEVFAKGAATLSLIGGEKLDEVGTVDFLDSQVSQETGNITMRARFPNGKGILKHGASARISIGSNVPGALVIPQKSTFEVQQRLCVYVVDAEDVVRLRTVQPSFRLPHHFVIGGGLEPTDRFIFEGIQRVREGEAIAADLRDAATVAPL